MQCVEKRPDVSGFRHDRDEIGEREAGERPADGNSGQRAVQQKQNRRDDAGGEDQHHHRNQIELAQAADPTTIRPTLIKPRIDAGQHAPLTVKPDEEPTVTG